MKRVISGLLLLSWAGSAEPGTPRLEFEEKAAAPPPRPQRTPQARTTPLSLAQLQQLLARLAPLRTQPEDRQDFALREGSLPAPKVGQRVPQAFPPEARPEAPTVEKKPIEVLRYSPEGEVELAPQVSVTFNQPMVELSSTGLRGPVPARMTPAVEGEWRWLGTQTLLFKPKTRLPMATSFRVEVEAAQPVSWTFATPAPRLQSGFPQGGPPVGLRPVLFLGFDQRIEADLLASRVRFSGGKVRRASAEEVAADSKVSALVRASQEQRSLALVPSENLKPGTSYTLTVPAGTGSLEGPRTTSADQSLSFSTYHPLAVDSGPAQNQPPGQPLYLSFNNDLVDQPVKLTATPEIPGLRAVVRSGNLWIQGRTRARISYQLHLPAELTDVFGQKLGTNPPLTLQVGPARPLFVPPRKRLLLLDPGGAPQLAFHSVNQPRLTLQVRSVQPEDWAAYQEALRHQHDEDRFRLPGELMVDREIAGNTLEDEVQTLTVDLSKPLEAGNQLLVSLAPADGEPDRRRLESYHGWVQRSALGVNVAGDKRNLLVWVNRLADGAPVAGASVQPLGGRPVVTGPDGLATLPSGETTGLLVRLGQDRLFVPRTGAGFSTGAGTDPTRWYVTDDRKLYKPGETVSVKGWLRRQLQEPRGGLQATPDRLLSYKLRDARGNEVLKGQTSLGALGGFDFQLPLPKNLNLGKARLELKSDGSSHRHLIEVQEFRRPEFEVTARAETGSALVGGSGSWSLEAGYFAGGGLKDAPVHWQVVATPTNYSPPHWEGYTFGVWSPWWDCDRWWDRGRRSQTTGKSFQDTTDGRGRSTLELSFLSVEPPRPQSLAATGTVVDVNRQSFSDTATMLVHPARVYVGIQARRTFVEAGKPMEYQVIVTDLEGKAVAGRPVAVKLYRHHWVSGKQEVFSQTLTSGRQPMAVSLPPQEGGTYELEATVSDDDNRRNQSLLTTWVAGGAQPPSREVEMQKLTLVPDKPTYQPHEVAEILVQSPFTGAQALVTLERHGLVSHQLLDLTRGSATLKVPLEEAYMPNLHVTVDAVGQEAREGGGHRPAQARGSLDLEVSARGRQLKVEVKARHPKAEPGSANQLEVRLKDAAGKPVADGEVALLVVDESVLALIGGQYANPFDVFYTRRAAEVLHTGVRHWIELAEDPLPQREADGEEVDDRDGLAKHRSVQAVPLLGDLPILGTVHRKKEAGPGGRAQTPIRMRKDFAPLAFYAPSLRSDAEGRVRAPFKLPDNLTRYRVVALAVAGSDRFGMGQSSLVARQPLMIRPSPPRFLNFGDRCELPVVIQNQTDQALPVEVACRALNLKVERAGVSLKVPANDRVEVRFPVSAEQAGTARLQWAVSSGDFADSAEVEFPVWTPATSEAVATYGVLDQGAVAQPVSPPPEVFQQFGGLEVSTSSTALAELTDAFLYLRQYPYECAEQISSRVLSTVALAPVLKAFGAPGLPREAELKASLAADVRRLEGMQNRDGGWDYWKRDRPSVPWVSLHVAHALVRLRQGGHPVPEDMYTRALRYAQEIERHLPAEYSDWCKRHVRGYALYVLQRAGKADSARARQLLEECGGVEKASFECLGWLLPTLRGEPEAALIRRHLYNRVSESASTAQFTTRMQDGEHLILASNHRDDAILLEALSADSPDSDLLPKLVRGLLDHRVAGRWASTQENCFVLLALHEYFERYEKVTPDFVARLWLGPRFAGEQSFKGRSADSKELRVPMAALSGPQDLVLTKEGTGRLYYRLGLKFAPLSLQSPALERGFVVDRVYEAVDDNRDVRRAGDGSWHIKAGARVKVTLTMAAPTMRYHVALVDPLPAGLEALNPALKGTQAAAQSTQAAAPRHRWWHPHWYDHENLRDERVEAFTSWLYYGVHSYSYFARATTPGQFVVPPAKAEEMYHPETFGRSASDRVVVEP